MTLGLRLESSEVKYCGWEVERIGLKLYKYEFVGRFFRFKIVVVFVVINIFNGEN